MIEQTTGTELLRRLPARGIVPTSSGLAVGERVQEFLEQSRIFESDLMSLTGDLAGTLRMGCYAPTAPYVLPPILKRISEDYPSISIELKEGDMQSIADLLSSGAIDVALTYRRTTPEAQPFIPMFRATPIALIPDESPLAQKPEVDLQDLAELPMILLDLPGTRAYFCSLFEARGLRPNIAHTTKSSSVLRGLVAANFGYALMNICGPNDRVGQSGYVARPIKGDLESPQYGVAYTPASQKSAIVKSVLASCREVAERGDFDDLLFSNPQETPSSVHIFR
jgi:DNA-binding transcriptional LysR family regulator